MKKYPTFFNYPINVSSGIPIDTEEAMDKHFAFIQNLLRIRFEKEYLNIIKDKAKELIEFHWRHYRRQGGTMDEFIKELKNVNYYRFAPHNKDIFLCYIEANEGPKTPIEQNKTVPRTFKEAFTVQDWRKYIDILATVENPIIDKEWNFIGSARKHKGVLCNWITELRDKNIIQKQLTRKTLAKLVNSEIIGIELGEDGKSFDNDSKEYRKNYKEILTKILRN